jgi:predicted metalloprotease with PDZ domain
MVLAVGGCVTWSQGSLADSTMQLTQGSLADVGRQFSQQFQCPIDRVTVGFDARVATPPSASVAADPTQLALYNQQLQTEIATTRAVRVAGCGQDAGYLCVTSGGQVQCVLQQRGWLGVSYSTLTRVVDRVEPGGLGERIGFRVGDTVIGLDHQAIQDPADVLRQLNDPRSQGHIITVLRGGIQQIDLAVPHPPN